MNRIEKLMELYLELERVERMVKVNPIDQCERDYDDIKDMINRLEIEIKNIA
jgi:hypothetical protein